MASPFLSVVIPAYNEGARIASTLEQVLGYLGARDYSWEVALADDGSSDHTADEVARVAAQWGVGSRLRYLPLPHRGKGWAVRQGMMQAEGEYRFMCDADLAMSIDQLERFLPPVAEEYQVAVGSRSIPGASRTGDPRLRHVAAQGFSLVVRSILPSGISDTQCGFKCFHGEAAHRLFSMQKLDGFAFDAELLFLARRLGLRIIEVPIDWHGSTESSVRPVRDALCMTRDLLRVRWQCLRQGYGQPGQGVGDLI